MAMVRKNGLILRGGTWIYRRRVPERLQPILNLTEVKRTLSTRSKEEAQAKWPAVHAEVERMFAEAARQPAPSPEAIGYRVAREHRYLGPRGEEGLDLHLTSMLERPDLKASERVIVEALLRRNEYREGMKDNPPLSVVVQRYHAQRKLTPKSRLEFDGVLARFTRAVGGDLPVRSITPAHVRTFRGVMQTSPSSRGGVLSPATIRKNLNILKAVLSWARSEDIIDSNPTERIGVQKVDHNTERGRLPYDADDLAKLFSPEAVQMRAARRPSDYWLPWLALYTGARLEELGQLRVSDVRVEEGTTSPSNLETARGSRRSPV